MSADIIMTRLEVASAALALASVALLAAAVVANCTNKRAIATVRGHILCRQWHSCVVAVAQRCTSGGDDAANANQFNSVDSWRIAPLLIAADGIERIE